MCAITCSSNGSSSNSFSMMLFDLAANISMFVRSPRSDSHRLAELPEIELFILLMFNFDIAQTSMICGTLRPGFSRQSTASGYQLFVQFVEIRNC